MRPFAHLLLLSSAILIPQALAQTQQTSGSQHLQSIASLTGNETAELKQAAPISNQTLNPEARSSCSLWLPEPPASSTDSQIAGPANEPYRPLSSRCKFHLVLQQSYSPYTFASAGFQATWAQANGQWPHYGGGMQGWGKRFGASFADTQSRRFIQGFALSTMLHQDPRYFASYKRGFICRVWYAATRVVVVKNDQGESVFNSSEFLGALLASSLQNSYYPRHDRTFGDTMNRYGAALSSDAIDDLLPEFTPDLKRIFRRHAPSNIQKLERKLPIPAEDKP